MWTTSAAEDKAADVFDHLDIQGESLLPFETHYPHTAVLGHVGVHPSIRCQRASPFSNWVALLKQTSPHLAGVGKIGVQVIEELLHELFDVNVNPKASAFVEKLRDVADGSVTPDNPTITREQFISLVRSLNLSLDYTALYSDMAL